MRASDWNNVIALNPTGMIICRHSGFLTTATKDSKSKHNEKLFLMQGPLHKIEIESGESVVLLAKWIARVEIHPHNFNEISEWSVLADRTAIIEDISNEDSRFVIEDVPGFGTRVRWNISDLLYLEPPPDGIPDLEKFIRMKNAKQKQSSIT